MSVRVVCDTNVLVSAVGWGGRPGESVQLARDGRVQGLTCVEIFGELGDTLSSKLGFADDRISGVLAALLSFLELVAIPGELTGTQADPKDDKIIECAVVGRADYIVTGDRKHLLPLRRFQHIELVTPASFLAIVESQSR